MIGIREINHHNVIVYDIIHEWYNKILFQRT